MAIKIGEEKLTEHQCLARLSALDDALYAIGGKWKLKIIIALKERKMRFNELQRTIKGISARVLSNELKEMEMNGFVTRTVYTGSPVVIEYDVTEYCDSLGAVLGTLIEWGVHHREKVKQESKKKSAV